MSASSESSNTSEHVSPQFRFGPSPNYCSWGMPPHLMTGFLVQALRQHFAEREQFEDPRLRDDNLLWRVENPQGIVIESITLWNPDETQHRPAVLVARGDWHSAKLGINNQLLGVLNIDGLDRYSKLWTGTHTLFCKAVEAAQAEILAAEVSHELTQFGPEIRRYLDLKQFEVVGMDRLHQMEESLGGYAVPVTIAYASEMQWIIRQHAPKLKTIQLSLMAP